jgi:hypothetical protein
MAGRNSHPWFREAKRAWYAWVCGRQVRLAADKHEAWQRWHDLVSAQPTGETVSGLTAAFPARPLAPTTLACYTRLLADFGRQFGHRLVETLSAGEVEGWADRPSWGSSTRWLALTAVRALINFGVRSGRIGKNPLQGLTRPPLRSRGLKAAST